MGSKRFLCGSHDWMVFASAVLGILRSEDLQKEEWAVEKKVSVVKGIIIYIYIYPCKNPYSIRHPAKRHGRGFACFFWVAQVSYQESVFFFRFWGGQGCVLFPWSSRFMFQRSLIQPWCAFATTVCKRFSTHLVQTTFNALEGHCFPSVRDDPPLTSLSLHKSHKSSK